jgi:hypothetical protein
MVNEVIHNNSSLIDSTDRVRNHTPASFNQKIDAQLTERLHHYANQPKAAISERIEALKHEWDIERILELNASSLAFIGVVLSLTVDHRWLWLTGVVLVFLFQHSIQGWCPPLPVFRRFRVRTRSEIDQEKFALKALRGDFNSLPPESENAAVRADQVQHLIKS